MAENSDKLLREKLFIAQKNVEFLQNEHSKMLSGLHDEIDFLKEKCKALQFSLDVADISRVDEDRYVTRINALESEVVHWCQECRRLRDHLHYAEDVVSNLEMVLAKQYQQSEAEINMKDDKIVSLEKDLAQKSRTIRYLMAELRQHRNAEKADLMSKSSTSLQSKSNPPSSDSSKESINDLSRSVPVLSDATISEKIQSSLEKDKRARTISALEKSLTGKVFPIKERDPRHSSVTRLPPIVKITHKIASSPMVRSTSKKRSFVRQQIRLTEPEINVDALAIDQPLKSE